MKSWLPYFSRFGLKNSYHDAVISMYFWIFFHKNEKARTLFSFQEAKTRLNFFLTTWSVIIIAVAASLLQLSS